jgi:hypothetical protein
MLKLVKIQAEAEKNPSALQETAQETIQEAVK